MTHQTKSQHWNWTTVSVLVFLAACWLVVVGRTLI